MFISDPSDYLRGNTFITYLERLNITVTEDREELEDDIELLIDTIDAFNFSLAFAVAFYK